MEERQLQSLKNYLAEYDGPEVHIMEVCGSHTAAIAKNGIPGLLSPKIHLISGPGCPVCVTPSAYIDRLLALAMEPDCCVVTFGDLIRVPGSTARTPGMVRGEGGHVEMVYSPMDVVKLARMHPEVQYIFAAIGFETTTPVYALLIDTLVAEHITNVRLLTALKTMPGVIGYLLGHGADVQGILAPGHVCAVTGSGVFEPLAKKYQIPFAVAPFDGPGLLTSIAGLVRAQGEGRVMNFYPSVVSRDGNVTAQAMIDQYFEDAEAVWRGMGEIPGSGRLLREAYAAYDAGSRGLDEDHAANPACRCGEVLMGRIKPKQCPLYGKVCTPLTPQGACMVSEEGNCRSYFVNRRDD